MAKVLHFIRKTTEKVSTKTARVVTSYSKLTVLLQYAGLRVSTADYPTESDSPTR